MSIGIRMEQRAYQATKDELSEINKCAIEEIDSYLSEVGSPVLLLLQAHLYSENLLERYIATELPKGKKLIEKGRLTYFQKVQIAGAIGVMDNNLLSSLAEFNKARNNLAHNLNHEFTCEQLKKFSLPLGDVSAEFTERANGCLAEELRLTINHLVSRLAGYTITIEKLSGKYS
ncbi:hypothetical protein DM784_20965 [Vibrio furnissii]|nr:hypothetical protein DM784_20965 [Vibrio furnissii]